MESTSDFLSAKIRTGGGVLVRHSKMQIEMNVIYKLYMYVFFNKYIGIWPCRRDFFSFI